jgi:hypothetical protein
MDGTLAHVKRISTRVCARVVVGKRKYLGRNWTICFRALKHTHPCEQCDSWCVITCVDWDHCTLQEHWLSTEHTRTLKIGMFYFA